MRAKAERAHDLRVSTRHNRSTRSLLVSATTANRLNGRSFDHITPAIAIFLSTLVLLPPVYSPVLCTAHYMPVTPPAPDQMCTVHAVVSNLCAYSVLFKTVLVSRGVGGHGCRRPCPSCHCIKSSSDLITISDHAVFITMTDGFLSPARSHV